MSAFLGSVNIVCAQSPLNERRALRIISQTLFTRDLKNLDLQQYDYHIIRSFVPERDLFEWTVSYKDGLTVVFLQESRFGLAVRR